MLALTKKSVASASAFKFAVMGLLLGSLAACAWLTDPSKSVASNNIAANNIASNNIAANSIVAIADGVGFALLPPALNPSSESLLQSVSVSVGVETHDLLVQVETSKRHLIMVVLTTTGTRLATVKLDNGVVSREQLPVLPVDFKAEQLLAAYQLSQWPLDGLGAALQGPAVSITKSTTGATKRVLAVGGEPVIEITYSDNQQGQPHILYQHLQWRYQIDITTLEKHPL